MKRHGNSRRNKKEASLIKQYCALLATEKVALSFISEDGIDAAYMEKHIGDLARNRDLSKFIL